MGLHRGRKKEVDKKIDFNSLKALDNELKNKSDNDILKMDYCYFCSEKGKYQFVTVQAILDDALKQINGYIELLKNGKVSDSKIEVIMNSISILGGWVIMSLGSKRILSRKMPFKKINIEFILQ
jgi:capsid portal protein